MSLRFDSRFTVIRHLTLVLAGVGLVGAGFVMAQSRAERPMPQRPPSQRSLEQPQTRQERTPAPRPSTASTQRPAGTIQRPASFRIVEARPMARCTSAPNPEYWQRRDIMAEIQWMARRGSIAVHPVAEDAKAIEGSAYSGWVGAEYKPVGTTTESLNWLRKLAYQF